MSNQLPDLWWLPERAEEIALELAHQDPSSDDFQVDHGLHSLTTVPAWRRRHDDTNVFRSVLVYSPSRIPLYKGPFYVDIDHDPNRGDIEDARQVAKFVIRTLLDQSVPERDIKVLFSGRKGFNVEIRPEALNIPSAWTSRSHQLWTAMRRRIIDSVKLETGHSDPSLNVMTPRGTVIDTIKEHLRLEGSLNAWVDESRNTHSDRKEVVALTEFVLPETRH